jgi:hypothetical protein
MNCQYNNYRYIYGEVNTIVNEHHVLNTYVNEGITVSFETYTEMMFRIEVFWV